MVRKAKYLIQVKGRTSYAIDAFFNDLRWNTGHHMDIDQWKMSDNTRPYYARFLLQNHPEWWGFFELRRCKGEYPQPLPPVI
jgi:hypothetical protein